MEGAPASHRLSATSSIMTNDFCKSSNAKCTKLPIEVHRAARKEEKKKAGDGGACDVNGTRSHDYGVGECKEGMLLTDASRSKWRVWLGWQ